MNVRGVLLCFVLLCSLRGVGHAQPLGAEQTPPEQSESRLSARSVGIGTLGVLSAFLAHEAGHFSANLALGNTPRFEGFLVWGWVPFFAVAPEIDCQDDPCLTRDGDEFKPGRRGKYLIGTAGYHVQHITDEIILTRAPNIRDERAPFRKGMLLFNVFLSCFYAAGAFTGLQDPHGDLQGASDLGRYNQNLLAIALLLPAALDTYRYFAPESARWSAWASRGSKAAFLGLNFTF